MATPADRLGPNPQTRPEIKPPSFAREAAAGLLSIGDSISNFFEIVALETRLAGRTAALMVAVAVAATLLFVTAWGLLIAAAVGALMRLDFALDAALLLMATVSVAVAVVLALVVRAMSRHLTFRATRRALQRESNT